MAGFVLRCEGQDLKLQGSVDAGLAVDGHAVNQVLNVNRSSQHSVTLK